MPIIRKLKENPILKNIEWLDDTSNTLVHKIEAKDNHINKGSVLTVRESQVAIFTHRGQTADIFLPGKYKLDTNNIPLLTRLMSWKYGFETPFKSDVFFVSTRQFTNQKWGTTQPINIRDADYGAIQVRAFGAYSFQVDGHTGAETFMKEIFGTNSSFRTEDIADWLRTIVISAMTTAIGKSGIPFLDLAGNLAEFSKIVEKEELEHFKAKGLKLTRFIIESVSLPPDLQEALNKSTGLRMMGNNIGTYQQMAAADAMRNAASNPGMAGGMMGMGMGVGMGAQMGNVFGQAMAPAMQQQGQGGGQQAPQQAPQGVPCSKCNASVKPSAKFCHECGNTMGNTCNKCNAMIKPNARFCHECGQSTVNACKCGQELKAGAKFCSGCGEKQG